MPNLSFDNSIDEIPIITSGTPASMGDPFPYGSAGKITKAATIAQIRKEGWEIEGKEDEVLYWFEYKPGQFKTGRNAEYVWRGNLYPVPEKTV